MRNSEANHDAGHAQERIAEILRTAIGTPEEDGLEDETRRLMLHLSIEPLENAAPASERAEPSVSPRKPLLRRLLRRAEGDLPA